MNDEKRKDPEEPAPPSSTNGRGSGNPFGSFTIDFSGDSPDGGVAPDASLPISFGGPAGPAVEQRAGSPIGAAPGEGRTESKVIIVGSGPAGLTAAIYAA